MREIFDKTILPDGGIALAIQTPRDRKNGTGTNLMPDGVFFSEKDITTTLLYMLGEAYHAGYKEAQADASEAVRRLLYENNAPRKPAPKISETLDYRVSAEVELSTGKKGRG